MAAEIVDLDDYKLAKAAARGAPTFKGRLKVDLTPELTVGGLPDRALAFLVRSEPVVANYLQELITKILGLGRGFDSLGQADRVRVIDAHLLLADQFRFEVMYRLGWVASYSDRETSLIRLIVAPRARPLLQEPVQLSPNHPDYPEFKLRKDTDGQVVIRRLIPEAARLFIARHGQDGPTTRSPA